MQNNSPRPLKYLLVLFLLKKELSNYWLKQTPHNIMPEAVGKKLVYDIVMTGWMLILQEPHLKKYFFSVSFILECIYTNWFNDVGVICEWETASCIVLSVYTTNLLVISYLVTLWLAKKRYFEIWRI